jgi:predicted ArsR family transcriptional regulator
LKLTGEAVRQHLLQLHREGWAQPQRRERVDHGRNGRPATFYALTAAGDHLFPKNYDEFAVTLMDAVAQEIGAEGLQRILGRITDSRVSSIDPLLRDKTLGDRVEVLRNFYFEDDPFTSVEVVKDGYRLVERNCPYSNLALDRPAVCAVTVNTMTRLLGVRVRREETFQKGDSFCAFRVWAEEPIDASDWPFRPEGDS